MKSVHLNSSMLRASALMLAFAVQGSAQQGKLSQTTLPSKQVNNVLAKPGNVLSHVKFSASEGGLQDPLAAGDEFGSAVVSLGDVDGDGVLDMAIGSRASLAPSSGSAWSLLMNADGSIKSQTRLQPSDGFGNSLLQIGDLFGAALAPAGDLDGDGIAELVVGAPGAYAGDGSLWTLFLNADGSLRTQQRIDGGNAGGFASSLATLNDFDGDGVGDIAVGASQAGAGSIWMVYLNADGSEKGRSEIGAGLGGFTGSLAVGDCFGSALVSLGDMDGDFVPELAVGAREDGTGALWVLFMNADGSVRSQTKVGAGLANLKASLNAGDGFGAALAFLGDLNGDGTTALAVGAPGDDDGAALPGGQSDRGAIWILFLKEDGTVSLHQKISDTRGQFQGGLSDGDCFGESLSALVNFGNSPTRGLGVGAIYNEDTGSVFVLNVSGYVLLDFETAGDMMTPLPNGRGINPNAVYQQLVRVSSQLVMNYGPCIFDSNPGGGNDPGADQDLLVGTGNILILQEDATQSLLNIFDTPDDSRFGGTFRFDFTGRVEMRSILLIDIDTGYDEGVIVTMRDSRGNERIYDVPAKWTGDLIANPTGRGARRLNLDTLLPQPGFASTATATQDAGFGPKHVVHVTLSASSSMALDNVIFMPFDD